MFVIFFIFLINAFAESPPIRSEVARYTLLHDRHIVESDLGRTRHSSFFDLNLALSSGLKKMIDDVKSATQNDDSLPAAANDTLKELKVYELLTKNLNTERFLDAEIGIGFPLPEFTISKTKILLNPFFTIGAGSSFTFTNRESALEPKVQIYLRKEEKLGLRQFYLLDARSRVTMNLYQLKRADSSASLSSSAIAAKAKIFDINDLKENEVNYAGDLIYQKENGNSRYHFEMSEMKIIKSSKSKRKSLYGNKPLLHLYYQRLKMDENHHFSPLLGLHYRMRYDIGDGLYAGFQMLPFTRLSFVHLTFLLDRGFFTLNPALKTKWFEFHYSLKTPHKNPQDEVWVPTIHTIEINFPFT